MARAHPVYRGSISACFAYSQPSPFCGFERVRRGGMAVKGLLIWPLSTYTSAEQVTRACLDDYKKHLQAAKEEVKRKDLEWGVLTEALKQAKAEANALKLANDKLKKDQDAMVDYCNHSEVKVKALREEVDEAKVLAAS